MRQIELLPAATSRVLGALSLQNVLIATWVGTLSVVTVAVFHVVQSQGG